MSTKRILGITIFGVLFIAAVAAVTLLTPWIGGSNEDVPLPAVSSPAPSAGVSGGISAESEPPGRTEVTVSVETVQAVIGSLRRPENYSRDIEVKTFWEGGEAAYNISVKTSGDLTMLDIRQPTGETKHVFIEGDSVHIWYGDGREVYTGSVSVTDGGYRTSDEWQMLVTYEDILAVEQSAISGAGYTDFGGEDCVYVEYVTPLLRYTRSCYISAANGLVSGVQEYDGSGALVYSMTAGECLIGEVDDEVFALPGG